MPRVRLTCLAAALAAAVCAAAPRSAPPERIPGRRTGPTSQPASRPVQTGRVLRKAEKDVLRALGAKDIFVTVTTQAHADAVKRADAVNAAAGLLSRILQKKGCPAGLEWACHQVRQKHGVSTVTVVPQKPDPRLKALLEMLGKPDGIVQTGHWDGKPVARATETSVPTALYRYAAVSFATRGPRVYEIYIDCTLLPEKAPPEPPDVRSVTSQPASGPAADAQPAVPARPLREKDRQFLAALGHATQVEVFRPIADKADQEHLAKGLKLILDTLGKKGLADGLEPAARAARDTHGIEYFFVRPYKDWASFADHSAALGKPDATVQKGYWSLGKIETDPQAGPPLIWHHYTWLAVGTCRGRVSILRINCLAMPK